MKFSSIQKLQIHQISINSTLSVSEKQKKKFMVLHTVFPLSDSKNEKFEARWAQRGARD